MEWNPQCVLEFVDLLRGEPCIWNPKDSHHSNRNLVKNAWARIQVNFSLPCSIEDLKKKRNSLWTQYRDILRKIRASTESAACSEEIYKPSWFAFDAIDTYMSVVYDDHPTLSTETTENLEQSSFISENYSEESNIASPFSNESNTEDPLSRQSTSQSGPSFSFLKKRRAEQHLLGIKKETDEANEAYFIKNRSNRTENVKKNNECDLYGQLLSEKLKSLPDIDRLMLMNEIDNLVFNHIMNARKKKKTTHNN